MLVQVGWGGVGYTMIPRSLCCGFDFYSSNISEMVKKINENELTLWMKSRITCVDV